MPKCYCCNRSVKNKRLFSIPKAGERRGPYVKYKRSAWLKALNLPDDKKLLDLDIRICQDHFLKGHPSDNAADPNFVPTLNLAPIPFYDRLLTARSCFLCKSDKYLFEVTTNRLKLWKQYVPAISTNNYLCSNHFRNEDIIWDTGSSYLSNDSPRLALNAVPLLFTSTFSPNTPNVHLISNGLTLPPVQNNLNEIFKKCRTDLKMPSSTWGLHFLEEENIICISNLSMIDGNPTIKKSVTIDSYLKIHFYVENRKIQNDSIVGEIKSLEDIEKILYELHLSRLCPGGPSITKYNTTDFKSSISYVDENVWRHINCTFIYPNISNKCCKPCLKLHNIFPLKRMKLLQNQTINN